MPTQRPDRRPEMDRKWTPEVAERVLQVVAKTGSPKKAGEATGVAASTIADHRRRDPEFGARYKQAMDAAFNEVLGRAFDRSLDEIKPSDRLIEALLKFRFVDRAAAFDPAADESTTRGPLGLDPTVIVRLTAVEREALASALESYFARESEVRADKALG